MYSKTQEELESLTGLVTASLPGSSVTQCNFTDVEVSRDSTTAQKQSWALS